MAKKLKVETDKFNNWYLTINGYDKAHEDAKGGRQKDYVDVYKRTFPNMLDSSCWYPWARKDIVRYKDQHLAISREKRVGKIWNPKLYEAVVNLAECFVDEEKMARPEEF